MGSHIEQTIADLQSEINQKEEELAETKRIVNRLCVKIGQPAMYQDAEKPTQPSLNSIRRDQWYGQPISGAVRDYLAMRRTGNMGPATVNEIFDALTAGGFNFEAKDIENAKRGLRICLTKNSSIFHRLPDGKTYGLLDWYPEAKNRKAREPEKEEQGEEQPEDGGEQPSPAANGAPKARIVRAVLTPEAKARLDKEDGE